MPALFAPQPKVREKNNNFPYNPSFSMLNVVIKIPGLWLGWGVAADLRYPAMRQPPPSPATTHPRIQQPPAKPKP